MSLNIGKKGISLPFLQNSNYLYKKFYDDSKFMINKIKDIDDLIKIILGSQEKQKINIFQEAVPTLKK